VIKSVSSGPGTGISINPHHFWNSNDAIVVFSSEYEILYWNKGAQQLWGIRSDEVIGKKVTDILPTPGVMDSSVMAGYLPTPEETFREYQVNKVRLGTGPTKSIKLSLYYINDERYYSDYYMVFGVDVTNLVNMHEEARNADQAKSDFLAQVSHEVRTPLLGILGYCDILVNSSLNLKQMESVETIRFCSNQLVELVNNILDLSKIEARKIDLHKKAFSLRHMLQRTVKAIKPQLNIKKIDFQMTIDDRIPEYVIGDEAKIRQVVNNLLINAEKFTEEGYIKVNVFQDKGYPYNHKIKISIIDTGTGVCPELSDNIFKPFIRGNSTYSKKSEGSGLGLTISKQLVEIMGGEIWYEPNQELGSVFHFTVPLVAASAGEQVEESGKSYAPSISPENKTVLLAEDTKVNRKLIKYMLEEMGYRVITAHNGEECINILQNIYPDAILMDMRMPVLDGYAATRIIKNSSLWKDIPVIALTAYAMSSDIEKCMQIGCDHYLSKPFTKEQLYGVLDNCFAK